MKCNFIYDMASTWQCNEMTMRGLKNDFKLKRYSVAANHGIVRPKEDDFEIRHIRFLAYERVILNDSDGSQKVGKSSYHATFSSS